MGVSATGTSSFTLARLGRASAVLGLMAAAGFYLYGPAVTPAMSAGAAAECNELAGGNYRSYRLSWVTGVRPHWLCGDASAPEAGATDLGWWVSPRF